MSTGEIIAGALLALFVVGLTAYSFGWWWRGVHDKAVIDRLKARAEWLREERDEAEEQAFRRATDYWCARHRIEEERSKHYETLLRTQVSVASPQPVLIDESFREIIAQMGGRLVPDEKKEN